MMLLIEKFPFLLSELWGDTDCFFQPCSLFDYESIVCVTRSMSQSAAAAGKCHFSYFFLNASMALSPYLLCLENFSRQGSGCTMTLCIFMLLKLWQQMPRSFKNITQLLAWLSSGLGLYTSLLVTGLDFVKPQQSEIQCMMNLPDYIGVFFWFLFIIYFYLFLWSLPYQQSALPKIGFYPF